MQASIILNKLMHNLFRKRKFLAEEMLLFRILKYFLYYCKPMFDTRDGAGVLCI